MTKIDKQVLSGVIIFTSVILVVAMTTLQTGYAHSIYADPSDTAFHIRFATAEITGLSVFSDTAIDSINNSKNTSNPQVNTNTTNYNTTNSRNIQNNTLITSILANNLENRLQNAGAVLNITSQLPQVRNVSFAHLLNQTLSTLHGIPQDADIEKRQIAKNILSSNEDLLEILFFMPNGDAYIHEPYSRQQALTKTNFAFREYFQGAIRTNDVYLGSVVNSTAFGTRIAMIAVPVYSLEEDNSTLAGVWVGGLNLDTFNEELQSLNLTAGQRVVYVDSNGSKIADSDANNTNPQESFDNLTSFSNAIMNGQSGSTIETIGDAKMIVTYQPVNVFHNTWAVLLMQQQLPPSPPSNQTINSEQLLG